MQRLFSAFPNSLPGFGLLLLRIAAAVSIFVAFRDLALIHRSLEQNPKYLLGLILVSGIAACLVAGLATPLAAGLASVVLFWAGFARGDDGILYWCLAGANTSLIMIGPGAWSIDAKLFGRRRIDIKRR